ncbi:MAG: ABC transporter permease [Microbacteriaceae bacterium]|nr:ABC transporter permease [Microbacteriaceae bacterium]
MILRLGTLLAGWLGASLLIFAALRVLPGDVAAVLGGTESSPETIAQIRAELGLEAPLWQQYWDWLSAFLRGDMGRSTLTKMPVAEQVAAKAAVTVPLAVLGLGFALLFAVPLGIWSAYRARTRRSEGATALALAVSAAPPVWVAMLLISLLAVSLRLLPAQGFPASGWADPGAAFRSLLLPALAISLVDGAILFRFVRSATLAALHTDTVRCGMSFGLTRAQALVRFGLPQVALSLLGLLGVQFAALLAGTVVIEHIFNLPGLGSMLVADVNNRDLPQVQSVLLLLTGAILLLGAVLDILQRLADPRLRSRGAA